MADAITYKGGCHCGLVLFEVVASKAPLIIHCNCSICVMKQNYHFIVPKANFKLLQGMQHLSTYTFNSHQAKHTFCKVCGVQSFYTPRSNPDGYGIMPHCIFGDVMDKTNIRHFDGQHWEQEIVEKSFVKNLSKE